MPSTSLTSRFSLPALLVAGLIILTILNPVGSLDIAALLLIGLIIIQKICGEYAVVVLLALRPTLDWYRDYTLFASPVGTVNVNAGISLLLLAWSAVFFFTNRSYIKNIPAKLPWLVFAAWCALTLSYSFDHAATITETLKVINLASLYGIVHILYQKYEGHVTRSIRYGLMGSAALPTLLALFQLVTRTGRTIDDVPNRIFGTFAHPNLLGIFSVLLVAAWLHFVYNYAIRLRPESSIMALARSRGHGLAPVEARLERRTAPLRWSEYALGALPMIVITFTYARVAWIGLVLLLAGVAIFFYRRLFWALLIGITLFFLLFPAVNTYLRRHHNINLQSNSVISRLTERNEDADSIQWRADIANKILPLLGQRLLTGYGYGSFTTVWENNKGIANVWDDSAEAHNDYLKIAFEAGVIGLVLYLSIFISLIVWIVHTALARGAPIPLLFLGTIGLWLAMSFSDNMLRHTPVIWWYAALWGYWAGVMGKE